MSSIGDICRALGYSIPHEVLDFSRLARRIGVCMDLSPRRILQNMSSTKDRPCPEQALSGRVRACADGPQPWQRQAV